jgi:protein tyrosine phosphatase (PTP) superfamily phosphohydrolase (DUF442 family)
MGLSASQKITSAIAAMRGQDPRDLSTEVGRWQGHVYAQTFDHGWLRRRWRNEGQIAEGLYRSNHPDATALAMWKARGIKEVISLRPAQGSVHAFEAERCSALGLRLRNAALASRAAPSVHGVLALLDIFDTIDRPALIHCKSGADRTGLAAAIWAIHVEGRPVAEAAGALNLRHLHLKWSKTGVLDRFLEAYAARLQQGPIALRTWVETEYDPTTL